MKIGGGPGLDAFHDEEVEALVFNTGPVDLAIEDLRSIGLADSGRLQPFAEVEGSARGDCSARETEFHHRAIVCVEGDAWGARDFPGQRVGAEEVG